MSVPMDCHMHTAACGHASGTVGEYVAAAREAGVAVVTFTDHLPLPVGIDPTREYAMAEEDLGRYVADVRQAAEEAAASGGPEVLCGIEADWLPEHDAHVRSELSRFDFDVVLGSVHFVDGWAFDDPAHVEEYRSLDIDRLWERYFAQFALAASSGLFDVMAHPDLVKKFGYYPSGPLEHFYAQAAQAMAEGGVAVEVSSAGLRKPCGEIYPSLGLLRACRRLSVPATFGSDAHAPGDVGAGFSEARALLIEAGYGSLVYYRSREVVEVPL